jgi:hypothetical protein
MKVLIFQKAYRHSGIDNMSVFHNLSAIIYSNYNDRIPQIISEIQLNEVPDSWALLYNSKINETLAMNETGILIYQLIDGKRTIQEIIDFMSSVFETPPKIIGTDVRSFINSLIDEKIVSWKDL